MSRNLYGGCLLELRKLQSYRKTRKGGAENEECCHGILGLKGESTLVALFPTCARTSYKKSIFRHKPQIGFPVETETPKRV